MRLILLGPPGAGKGTQAKDICEHFHIPQISTGVILRQAIHDQSELGKKIATIVDGGRLVPDELINELVLERIKEPDCRNGYLLDGFPRTVNQAEVLQAAAAIDYVIDIEVPRDELIERLTGRRIHQPSGRTYHLTFNPPKTPNVDDLTGEPLIQREDDSKETVLRRLEVYEQQTQPLKAFYQTNSQNGHLPKYAKIDGRGAVSTITERIFSVLTKGNTYEEDQVSH